MKRFRDFVLMTLRATLIVIPPQRSAGDSRGLFLLSRRAVVVSRATLLVSSVAVLLGLCLQVAYSADRPAFVREFEQRSKWGIAVQKDVVFFTYGFDVFRFGADNLPFGLNRFLKADMVSAGVLAGYDTSENEGRTGLFAVVEWPLEAGWRLYAGGAYWGPIDSRLSWDRFLDGFSGVFGVGYRL